MIGHELRLALEWWLQALQLQVTETRLWRQPRQKKGVMLCDARSVPPRVAAVLFIDRKRFYSDWQPDEEVMQSFRRRNDNQIMALELLSVAFGSCALSLSRSASCLPLTLQACQLSST